LDWQLDLLDHTQLHTITVYTLLQLTTVHYNTCRVFTLYLQWLPVFQYRRIRSPATLQLFSEDCCSARILTRNCSLTLNYTRNCYCQSQSHVTTDDQSVSKSWIRAPCGSRQSQSQSYFTTDDQSVSKSWFQGPWRSHDLIDRTLKLYSPWTDPKENTSTKQPAKKTLVASIVGRLLVARQRPSSVDFAGPKCARHTIYIYIRTCYTEIPHRLKFTEVTWDISNSLSYSDHNDRKIRICRIWMGIYSVLFEVLCNDFEDKYSGM
jgi:hypothetical protein